jgi:hypothetical protein
LSRRDPWRVLISNTKRRAKRRGITYELTEDDWARMRQRANNRCELTGIEFDWTRFSKKTIRPMAASCDRIDSSKGYTLDNCRLVIFAINCAMGSWGECYLYSWSKEFIKCYESRIGTNTTVK